MLGFGSLAEYLESVFGWSARFVHEKMRVAHALEALPKIANALKTGVLSWSAVRELTRVATRSTEEEWLKAVLEKSMREIEELVSGRKRGDKPSDPSNPEAKMHDIRARVSAATFALWRDAITAAQKSSDVPLSEDEAIGSSRAAR